ncbi:hypothetical protein [Bremerella sp.]|uniref:hypothetical protein n=1 Tax=Bremerella sp. TaxID=2795602 RepID=UPI00391C0FAD
MASHPPVRKPEKQGAGHTGHGSQVAVRDGNLLLCPCCGEVLMELSDGLVDDLEKAEKQPKVPSNFPLDADGLPRPPSKTLDQIIRRQEAAKEAAHRKRRVKQVSPASPVEPEGPRYQADPIVVPIAPDIAAYEFPEHDPPPPPKRTRYRTPKIPLEDPWLVRRKEEREREPKREQKPRRRERPLVDPWSYRSARLYAWMFYRMQKLNVQLIGEICAKHEAIEQLENDLTGNKPQQSTKQELRVPRPSPLGRASQVPVPSTSETQPTIELNPHAHADVGMAPDVVAGSTSNVVPRHAQEDLGVAPVARDVNQRGPP